MGERATDHSEAAGWLDIKEPRGWFLVLGSSVLTADSQEGGHLMRAAGLAPDWKSTCHLVSQKPGVLKLTAERSSMVTGCLDRLQWGLKKRLNKLFQPKSKLFRVKKTSKLSQEPQASGLQPLEGLRRLVYTCTVWVHSKEYRPYQRDACP